MTFFTEFKLSSQRLSNRSLNIQTLNYDTLNMWDLPPIIIAQALTSYEFRLFQEIQRSELLNTKKRPNVTKMISHFNTVQLSAPTPD